jgi:type I pantothenate kinase
MADLTALARLTWGWREQAGPVLVLGVTGGVACGKSTLTAALVDHLRGHPSEPRVECVGTDGFLRPNASLVAAGLINRKGFPETYDRGALVAALRDARLGPTTFPAYSHVTYDVDPALSRIVDRPDILIVEGLGLGDLPGLDRLIYIDAAESDQQSWFVTRFLAFCEVGRRDAASFYARFREMDEAAAAELGATVWKAINLPNLRDHIAPLRARADAIVRKGSNHVIEAILSGG